MLKIRLTRKGKKNKAFFRIVVAEHTSPVKGKFIEVLGFLNPHTKEKDLKEDRIKYWLEKGAQCSDSVHNLLVSNGIVKGPKKAVRIKKKRKPAPAEALAGEKEKKPAEEEKVEELKPEKKTEILEEQKPSEDVKAEVKAEKPAEEPKSAEEDKEEKAEEAKPEEAKPEEKKE